MTDKRLQTSEPWFPEAAATRWGFARARIDPTDVLWVHAPHRRSRSPSAMATTGSSVAASHFGGPVTSSR